MSPDEEVKEAPMVYEDSEYVASTLSSLNKLRRNRHFCDVVLQVGAHEIHAHRPVLACASPYLFDLFSMDADNGHEYRFKLNGGFEKDAFEHLVDYAYTARLEVPANRVKAVYVAAVRLKMYRAARKCGEFLVEQLSPNNCIGVCTLDGKVYCIGGWNGQFGTKRCDAYDPVAGSWIEVAPLLDGRSQAGVCAFNGCVYAVGGCDLWNCLSIVERYDPQANKWTYVAPLHTARRGCGAAFYNGKLFAVGGSDGSRSLCSVEVYDPETNAWTAGPKLTSCRANVGVAVVGNKLYAVGGFTGKGFLNTIECLDANTNEWTTFTVNANGGEAIRVGGGGGSGLLSQPASSSSSVNGDSNDTE